MAPFKTIASNTLLALIFASLGAMTLLGLVAIPFSVWMAPDAEWSQKPQWSLLQSLSVKYQDTANRDGILILPRALRTAHTVIGLPRADQPQGYVWVIADPRGNPKLKAVPERTPFRLKSYELYRIESRLPLDPEILTFIRQGVEP